MSKAPAVDYAIEIIELFAEKAEALGIADISNSLGINKNAVSRILEALIEKNWIYPCCENGKKYKLTLRPFSVVSKTASENDIARIASPYIEELNRELCDCVYLGVKNGRNVIYTVHFDSKKEVRVNGRLGGEYPLNCAAPGKVLLSYSDDKEISEHFAKLPEKRTVNTICDFDLFLDEAEKIKGNGYAVDNEEFAKGIICIAVPVFGSDGKVVASVGLSTLTIYDSSESLINDKLPLLKKTAAEISANLGFSGKE